MYLTNVEIIAPPGSVVGFAPIIALNPISALADLDVSQVVNGFVLGVSIENEEVEKLEWWKVRALLDGEEAVAGAVIICTADPTRCWAKVG